MADLSVRLNAQELAALAGLPSLSVVAYVLAIRPWMDYRSGLCGVIRGISWQSIREAVEVDGHQGMPRQSFNEMQLRRAVAHLEKRGLLTRRSSETSLIFRANFATQDNGVQIKAVPMSVPMSVPHAQAAKPATARDSAKQKPKADPKAVPKAVPPPAYPLTTKQPPPHLLRTVGGGEGDELIFHHVLKPEYHEGMKTALQGIEPDYRQTALDELAGAVVARAGTSNPIRSQLAYFRAILADIRGGEFMPTHSADVKRARKAEAARKLREATLVSETQKECAKSPRFRPGVPLASVLKNFN